MDIEEVKTRLCYYDSRNPDNIIMDGHVKNDDDCYCDNCFYGRTKLAEYILELIENKNEK